MLSMFCLAVVIWCYHYCISQVLTFNRNVINFQLIFLIALEPSIWYRSNRSHYIIDRLSGGNRMRENFWQYKLDSFSLKGLNTRHVDK